MGSIAGVAAVFTARIAVADKLLAAISTDQPVRGFPVRLVSVAIPPSISAPVTAEGSGFSLCELHQSIAALFACFFVIFVPRIVGSVAGINGIPAAERLNRVHRKAERFSNL
jgi:hypothetical protein